MIRMESVTKRYGTVTAVADLSLEVRNGEVCVVVGPSGCGKTTTLRMINRLIEPTAGSIYVDGRDTRTVRPEYLRRTIGYAIQGVGLFPHLTVAQNIEVVPTILRWERGRIDQRTVELLDLVGLDAGAYAVKYPRELSGGEAQRVGVARALAADPPILLMDEPFGAVDPLTRERLQQQFLAIQRRLKKAVVLVTHDLDEAVKLADKVAVMRSGRLVQYDSPEALLARPADAFVSSFVGADRALKRLSRIPVRAVMKPAVYISFDSATSTPLSGPSQRHVWVIDANGRLTGCLDARGAADVSAPCARMAPSELEQMAVLDSASARDALSRMLGQGLRVIPVIDDNGRLTGQVALRDIEEVTVE
jgi:osmoprotectant transport system ATP-binding protein